MIISVSMATREVPYFLPDTNISSAQWFFFFFFQEPKAQLSKVRANNYKRKKVMKNHLQFIDLAMKRFSSYALISYLGMTRTREIYHGDR